jgi:tRNA dimethylallyltransferase
MTSSSKSLPPVLALTGPTASGKTAAAMALAELFPLEIISVDSALVYRGMDIGTAKPTAQERALVPHHLIDIREPTATYSAADFVRDVASCSADIQSRGKRVLLVGGTMMYLHALRQGLNDLPAANEAVRAEIEAEAAAQGWPAMHQKLSELDPVTAQRLSPNDSQRIQRALEVYRISGRTLSVWFEHPSPQAGLELGSDTKLWKEMPVVSLEPHNRQGLHDRIAQRFDLMLQQGLVEEVRRLRQNPALHIETPAMRCVGYRQVWQALDEAEMTSPSTILDIDQVRAKGIAATRQLAKRQLTWLRKMPERTVVACDDSVECTQQVLAWAKRFWL